MGFTLAFKIEVAISTLYGCCLPLPFFNFLAFVARENFVAYDSSLSNANGIIIMRQFETENRAEDDISLHRFPVFENGK